MWLRATPPANYRPMTLAKNLKYILLNESFPLDMAYSEYAIFRGQRALREAVGRRASFAFPEVKRLTSDTGPEVYVLIIGESSRRESWSLFGYGRKTNPQLASLVGKGLIPFSGIRSNANLTIYSLPLALTGNAPAESRRASEEKSIVGLAKQAGFDTYWISAQEMFGGAAGPVGSIAEEASHVQFLDVSPRKGRGFEIDNGAYDEQVLRPFKEALAQETGNTKKVIVIHTMGSHYEYLSRVPAERRVFNSVGSRGTGTEAKSPAGEKLDAYDDSILYTDYVIKNVIDILAGLRYPSAMLYFSDHGERMYCEAYPHESFGHGFLPPSEDELDVPVLLWFSKSYERRYPPLAEAARANAHLKTSLGSVFDTFADLMRVDLRRTRRNQSLLSQSPGPASLDVFGVDGTVLVKGLPQRVCGPDHL